MGDVFTTSRAEDLTSAVAEVIFFEWEIIIVESSRNIESTSHEIYKNDHDARCGCWICKAKVRVRTPALALAALVISKIALSMHWFGSITYLHEV